MAKSEEYRTITPEFLEQDRLNRRAASRRAAELSYAEQKHREEPGTYGGAEREGDPSCPHLKRKATHWAERLLLGLLGD